MRLEARSGCSVEGEVLSVDLHLGVGEPAADQAPGVENAANKQSHNQCVATGSNHVHVVHVYGDRVLDGIADNALRVGERGI